jgi:hypothetical protein
LRSLEHLETSSEHMNGRSYVTLIRADPQETPLDGRRPRPGGERSG